MVKEMTVLCDICREQKAYVKCFLCGKDICEDHNFGGKHSNIMINATVYNDTVFNIMEAETFMDCCPNCTDKLKDIIRSKKGDFLTKKIKENVVEIKSWLLNEIKKE